MWYAMSPSASKSSKCTFSNHAISAPVRSLALAITLCAFSSYKNNRQ